MRILSGGIMQESHSFNPVTMTRADFDETRGEQARQAACGTNSILGGIVDEAAALGIEVDIPLMLVAQSGGPVEDEIFDEVVSTLADASGSGRYDAIVLALHGGMLTQSLDDPEGVLFTALRNVVGPNVPITAGFDLHAHVTGRTIADCDFLTAFRSNPHNDQGATGRRSLRAAHDILTGAFNPSCASVHFPMLTLGNDRTDESGPLQDLQTRIAEIIAEGRARDISVFNAQQFLDVPDLGQTVLTYTNGDPDGARAIAESVAFALWDARDAFVGDYATLEASLRQAAEPDRTRPLILGDLGDRVAAGGPGDSTYILNALLQDYPDLPAAVPITDPAAVEACLAAGPGAEVALSVGGRYSTIAPQVLIKGRVIACDRDRPLTMAGPYEAGRRTTTGPFAVVQTRATLMVLTAKPNAFIDPEYFRAMGVEPAALRVVVTRSGYHFSLNYAPVGTCITIDTPGMTSYRPLELPFRFARPFYPADPIGYRPTFSSRTRAAR